MPFRLGAHAITGYTGLIMDDRNPPSDNAVKQRGFANIGPSDNSDDSLHSLKML